MHMVLEQATIKKCFICFHNRTKIMQYRKYRAKNKSTYINPAIYTKAINVVFRDTTAVVNICYGIALTVCL